MEKMKFCVHGIWFSSIMRRDFGQIAIKPNPNTNSNAKSRPPCMEVVQNPPRQMRTCCRKTCRPSYFSYVLCSVFGYFHANFHTLILTLTPTPHPGRPVWKLSRPPLRKLRHIVVKHVDHIIIHTYCFWPFPH